MKRCLVLIAALAAQPVLSVAAVAYPQGTAGSPIPCQAAVPCDRQGENAARGASRFYVAVSGSDENAGTQSEPWRTIAKVNSSAPPGSLVSFNGGDTFSTTTGIVVNVSVTSYGVGQAVVSSDNTAPCIRQINPAGLSITNIGCIGGGNRTNKTSGISVINDQVGNTKLAGPTIDNVTVSGFGLNGIEVKGLNGTSGFSGIKITNSTVHDVTGNGGVATGCIVVASGPGYGTNNVHSNVLISNALVYNCTGTAGQTNWTGSGIVVSETQDAVIQYSVAHDFGSANTNCGGPVGIWTYDSDRVTIQFNEAYNGRTNTGAGGCDGGGFDLDGGVTNSIMQYNFAHNNASSGFLFDSYEDDKVKTWDNNTARFNISQNNIQAEFNWVATSTMRSPKMYNNTAYAGRSGICFDTSFGGGTMDGTPLVANNVFFGLVGRRIIHVPNAQMMLVGNDYFGSTKFSWRSVDYMSFAAWQLATGREIIDGENVGLTSDPQIYAPGGGVTVGGYVPAKLTAYNLQAGSPMIRAGINLESRYGINPGTQDYYGVPVAAASLPVGAAAGAPTASTAAPSAPVQR